MTRLALPRRRVGGLSSGVAARTARRTQSSVVSAHPPDYTRLGQDPDMEKHCQEAEREGGQGCMGWDGGGALKQARLCAVLTAGSPSLAFR